MIVQRRYARESRADLALFSRLIGRDCWRSKTASATDGIVGDRVADELRAVTQQLSSLSLSSEEREV